MPGWATVVLVVAMAFLAHPGGALQDAETRAKAAYARAVDLEAQGNQSAALVLLWEAAGLAPRDADIQQRLGEALERMGALDAAIDAYRGAVTARPALRKAVNSLILALAKAGQGEEAVARARSLVAADPTDPDRLFTLGLAQSEQDVSEAIKAFRRALELAPRHTLARYNLALVLRRTDRLSEALDELNKALAVEARPEIHYTLGVIYLHQGELDRAASALGGAVAAEPRYADAHYTLGAVLKAKRDWTAAARSLRRAIALRPDLTAAHYTLAEVLRSAGDDDAARAQLAEAERLRERARLQQEASVWTAVGSQKLEAGDPQSAADHFRRATAASDEYAPAHYQLGVALERLGQREAARAAFRRAQQLNPSLVPPPGPGLP
jgi:tetratricopeptide (TPR) repeat protein